MSAVSLRRLATAVAGIISAASLVAMSACGGTAASAQETPDVLRLGVPPGEADPAMLENASKIGDVITEATGIPVEVTQTSDYLAIVEAMRSGLLDVALFSPMPTVLAENEAKTQTLAVALGAPYRTDIICSPDSGVSELSQIQGHSFAFVDPGSTSGNFIPRLMLTDAGVDLDTLDSTFAGGHDVAAISVQQGSTDCAAVASLLLPRLVESGTVSEDDYNVIAESDIIPISLTVIARDGLSPEVTDKIANHLIESQSPALLELSQATELVRPEEADWTMFYDAADQLGIKLEDVE